VLTVEISPTVADVEARMVTKLTKSKAALK